MRKLTVYKIEVLRRLGDGKSGHYTVLVAARNLKNAFAKLSSRLGKIPRGIPGNCIVTGNYTIMGKVII